MSELRKRQTGENPVAPGAASESEDRDQVNIYKFFEAMFLRIFSVIFGREGGLFIYFCKILMQHQLIFFIPNLISIIDH